MAMEGDDSSGPSALRISDSVTIAGPGAHLLSLDASRLDPTPASNWRDETTGDDGDGSRVFRIDDGNSIADKMVVINQMTITGADYWYHAIFNSENLSITSCRIIDNGGGGIHSERGNLTVSNCMVSGNAALTGAGGIGNSSGELTVVDSTISGNSGSYGGIGIFHSRFSLIRSSILHNSGHLSGSRYL